LTGETTIPAGRHIERIVRARVRPKWIIIGAGTLVIVVLAAVAFAAIELGHRKSAGGPARPVCSPKPCTELGGWELYLRNINVTGGRVSMDVSFKNNTPGGGLEAVSYRHTSPMDFLLRYPRGDTRKPVFDTACPSWDAPRIERGGGAGPDHLCFNAVASGLSGAELQWTPDEGAFSTTGTVPLG
jgi:hypothetical protein